MIRLAKLTLTIAAVVLGVVNQPSSTRADTSPKVVKAIYSSDDSLCKPMAKTFTRLNRQHRSFISEPLLAFPKPFEAIGITQPPHLSDPKHPYIPLSYAGALHAFYRVSLTENGPSRLVYIEDRRPLPDIETLVWIFKPGSEYRELEPKNENDSRSYVDPGSVDLLVDFYDGGYYLNRKYYYKDKEIAGDYYFEKIYTDADRRISLKYRYNKDLYVFSEGHPQRLFFFKSHYYFLTGNPLLNYGLVYRIQENLRLDDVCYFATKSMDAYARKQYADYGASKP